MTDELMQQIKQGLEDEYGRGFNQGWYDGHAAAWGAIAEWATSQEAAARKAPEPSLQDEGDHDQDAEELLERPERIRFGAGDAAVLAPTIGDEIPPENIAVKRRLTPAQQRAVDYVRENPGLKSYQLQGIGKGILYGLVRSGVLAKRGAQFYTSEHA